MNKQQLTTTLTSLFAKEESFPHLDVCFYDKPEEQQTGEPAVFHIYPLVDNQGYLAVNNPENDHGGEGHFITTFMTLTAVINSIPFDTIYGLQVIEEVED